MQTGVQTMSNVWRPFLLAYLPLPEKGFVLQFWSQPVCRSSAKPLQSFPEARLCRTNTRLDSKGKNGEERVINKYIMLCCGNPNSKESRSEMTQGDVIKVTERS